MGQGVLPGDVWLPTARLRDRSGRQPRQVPGPGSLEATSGAVVSLLSARNRHAGVSRGGAVRGGVHGGRLGASRGADGGEGVGHLVSSAGSAAARRLAGRGAGRHRAHGARPRDLEPARRAAGREADPQRPVPQQLRVPRGRRLGVRHRRARARGALVARPAAGGRGHRAPVSHHRERGAGGGPWQPEAGAPPAIPTRRSGAAWGVAVCLATTFIDLLMFQLSKAVGAGGVLPPSVAAWVPNLIFGAAGVWLLKKART